MEIKDLITQFLEYLEIERNKSQKTLQNYDHYLRRFLDFTKVRSPSEIDLEMLRKYRIYLNRLTDDKGNTLQRSTQNYHVIALRAFLKYLAKHDIKTLSPEKIELAKTSAREVVFLEKDEMKRLAKVFNIASNNLNKLIRDAKSESTKLDSAIKGLKDLLEKKPRAEEADLEDAVRELDIARDRLGEKLSIFRLR